MVRYQSDAPQHLPFVLRFLAVTVLLGGVVVRPLSAQLKANELDVVVEAARPTGDPTLGIRFQVTLQNTSSAPLLLNAGTLLGNGRQLWSALSCELRSAAGASVPLGLHWRVGGVAGRVYFLGVPLRPGDSHTVTVTPADYHVGSPLQPGRYDLRCTFAGKQSDLRDATQLPAAWEGVAISNAVPIKIEAGRQASAG